MHQLFNCLVLIHFFKNLIFIIITCVRWYANNHYFFISTVKNLHCSQFFSFQIFESPEFSCFLAKRELRVHKGKQGLGIMIIEGNHKATGNGIFVSDIQEQSAAFHVSFIFYPYIKKVGSRQILSISGDNGRLTLSENWNLRLKLAFSLSKTEKSKKDIFFRWFGFFSVRIQLSIIK